MNRLGKFTQQFLINFMNKVEKTNYADKNKSRDISSNCSFKVIKKQNSKREYGCTKSQQFSSVNLFYRICVSI